jgi:PRTRC genetic system ThiF family protein
VVGCGGNGSAIVSGLPYLHQAMLVFGHPGGLQVTLIDPDVVSETNCVRQPFCRTEIGFPKAIVLAHRINLFWGLNWQGMQAQIQQIATNAEVDLLIGCVDTRKGGGPSTNGHGNPGSCIGSTLATTHPAASSSLGSPRTG